MTDGAKTPAPDAIATSATFLTSLAESLKKLSDAAGGESDEKAPPPPSLGQATAEAQQVRARFDSLIKWILGAIVGIGAIIFGSVPFANLAGVDFWPLGGIGLILAGLGILIVIWGASRAWEPVDSSLGELAQSLTRISPDDIEDRIGEPTKWAYQRFKKILDAEPQAHLGPGVNTIAELITKIKDLEAELHSLPGNDGTSGEVPSNPFVVLQRSAALLSFARMTGQEVLSLEQVVRSSEPRSPAVWRAIVAELASRVAAAETMIKRMKEAKEASDSPIVATAATTALVHELDGISELIRRLPTIAEISAAAEADRKRSELRTYLERRQLVLSEALVLLVRSRFLVARRWIALGAALTLAGGITYAYAIANPVDEQTGLNTIVQASVLPEATDAWTALVACGAVESDAESAELRAVLTSSDDADARQNGPFTVLVIEGPCAGETVSVEDGQGSYSPDVPPAADEPEAGATPAETPDPTLVSVTLLANTPELDAAIEACDGVDIDRAAGATLTALLLSSDDADARQDGEFTVTLASEGCDGATIAVTEANGTYAPVSAG